MSTDHDLPEIIVTRGEKLLAAVLAIFLLIGGLWLYFEPLDRETRDAEETFVEPTAQQQAAIDAYEDARRDLRRAENARDGRQRSYERAREEYRTDLDAGTPAAASRRAYIAARERYAEGRSDAREASEAAAQAKPAADKAERDLAAAEERAFDEAEAKARTEERDTFLARLAWVLGCIGVAFALFNWLRRRRSAYFVAGVAAVIAATAQAVVMAGHYIGQEIDLADSGPLVISLVGIVASILALIGLERYLAKRAPRRRVRRGQCPYCAYPVRGTHCEGCGRETIATCTNCSAERRVGTAHCAACGAS